MLTFFNVCFGLGLALAVLSAVSTVFGLAQFWNMEFDFDFDFGFDFDFDFGAFLPIRPVLMIIFITVLGGTGRILYGAAGAALSLTFALLAGFLIVFVINKLIVAPLKKLDSKESAADEDIIGLEADVTEKIFAGGYGRVTFIYDGNTISGPAKGALDAGYEAGTKVTITDVSDNVYIVEESGVCENAGFRIEN